MNLRLATLALLAVSMVGCASLGASPGQSGDAGEPTASDNPPSPGTSLAAPEGLPDAVWAAVIADLERRTGATVTPEVVSAEAVTWNDGSLGCPEPGQAYTQALVDGYQVILEVDGDRYDYRVGNAASVRLCEGGPLEGGG